MAQEKFAFNQLLDRQIQVQSTLFDKSATYNNIVVTLGYAGFFGIWNFSRNLINPSESKFLLTLLGFSLFLFVIWTVVTSFFVSLSNMKVGNALMADLLPIEKFQLLNKVEAEIKRSQLIYFLSWYWVFLLTLATGFLAGLLLLLLMVLDLIGIDASLFKMFAAIWGWFLTH